MTQWSTLAVTLALYRLRRGTELSIPHDQGPRALERDCGGADLRRGTQILLGGLSTTPILTRLIQQAIESNYDLKIAGERIRAAQDSVRDCRRGRPASDWRRGRR